MTQPVPVLKRRLPVLRSSGGLTLGCTQAVQMYFCFLGHSFSWIKKNKKTLPHCHSVWSENVHNGFFFLLTAAA